MRTNIVMRQRPAALLKAAAALTLAVASLAASVPAFAAPDAPTPLTARYGQQKLTWHKCFGDQPPEGLPPGAERLECSTMKAPLNWADPRSNQQIEIAVSRLRPATGQPRGTIFVNPGGPGAPAVTFPLLFLSRPDVVNAYEVVG